MIERVCQSWQDAAQRRTNLAVRRLLPLLGLLLCFGTGGAQTLSVSAGVSALTIHPGDSNVAIPVTVTAAQGSTSAVTVTLTGLPSGMTVTPATLTSGGSGTVYLTASVAADQEAFSPLPPPPAPQTATSTIQVSAIAGTAQASAPIALTVSLANPAFTPKTVNLPVVQINTSGAAITSKTVDVPGTITITSADGSTTFLPNASDSDNTATFHVHGNSTALMPKLPYNVKLNTSLDLLAAMGLTCPYVTSSGKSTCDKSKSYVLLANYDDKTMLRDWAASALANAIPYGGSYLSPTPVPSPNTGIIPTPSGTKTLMPWAPHSLFVELYLNGVYQGTYQLIEQVKVDSHRVNIPELTETQVSGDLSGGYLLEIDQHQDEDFVFFTPQGLPIGLLDPDFVPEVPEQTGYISNYVTTAENALFGGSFQDPIAGWRAYFDQASAVNYYIVNDLMGNVDGGDFFSSVYLYKAPDNPFLYMGPVWDFDISSGNVNYSTIVNPTVPYTTVQAPWFAQWFKDPSFKAAARQQWNAMKSNGVQTSWLSSISAEAATLQQAQANNFGRWPMQGIQVWPNPQAGGSYQAEVNYLLAWITLRMGYMDSFLNGTPATTTALSLSQSSAIAGTPVTLTAKVSGSNPTGVVIFSYNSVVLGQAAISSSGTATLTTSSIPAGSWQVSAAYAGDNNNALSISNTGPLTVTPALVQTVVNLSTSASSVQVGTAVTPTATVVGTQGATTPTGTVTFLANGTAVGTAALTGGTAVLSASSLPTGIVSLQAQYSGDGTYAASTGTGSVTVQFVPTSTTLTASPASALAGSSIALTATVAGAQGSTAPTGTVTFLANGNAISTVPLASGTATLNTSSLPTGQLSVQAQYSGDGTYASSTSAATTVAVLSDFTLTAPTPATIALSGSSSGSISLSLAPLQAAYPGDVTLSVSVSPGNVNCVVSPTTVAAAAGPQQIALTCSTSAVMHSSLTRTTDGRLLLCGLLLLPLPMLSGRAGTRRLLALVACVGIGGLVFGMTGCGSGHSSTTSTATVTAAAAGQQRSVAVTVTVQ